MREPLETLHKMSHYADVKAVRINEREYQVKLLYRALSKVNYKESLQNGGLVNAIMNEVKADKSTLKDDWMRVCS
jgi:hypothetical protein